MKIIVQIFLLAALTAASHIAVAQKIHTIPIDGNSMHSGGKLQFIYCDLDTTDNGRFIRPLIIVEPYDAADILKNDKIRYNMNYMLKDFGPLIDSLRRFYDIVYLDYNDGVADIFSNARLLEEAIEKVNARKYPVPGFDSRNVVIGISMGGLVARYCLASMEERGKDHHTRKYISLDVPHKGANLPVGLQAAVRDFSRLNVTMAGKKMDMTTDTLLMRADELLSRPASRQMLVYYVNEQVRLDNSAHQAFMAEYDRVGFPKKCINVGIAHGSAAGHSVLNERTMLFGLSEDGNCYPFKGLLDFISAIMAGGFISVQPEIKIWARALVDRKAMQVYRNKIAWDRDVFWGGISWDECKHDKSLYSTDDMLALDGAPGGYFSLSKFGVNAADLVKDIPNNMGCPPQLNQRFTFVPTVSALALSSWQDKLTFALGDVGSLAGKDSPFDDCWAPIDSNYSHPALKTAQEFIFHHLTTDEKFKADYAMQHGYSLFARHSFQSWCECNVGDGKPVFSEATVSVGPISKPLFKLNENIFIGNFTAPLQGVTVSAYAGDLKHNKEVQYSFSSGELSSGVHSKSAEASSPCQTYFNWLGNREGYKQTTTITVDDPVNLTNASAKNSFLAENEFINLRVGSFYDVGQETELQVALAQGGGWTTLRTGLRPSTSYSVIFFNILSKTNGALSDWIGKPLKFRVVKALLGGNLTYGSVVEGVKFTIPNFPLVVKELKHTACNPTALEVYLVNAADMHYVNLPKTAAGRYEWVLINAVTGTKVACTATPMASPNNGFYITPVTPKVFNATADEVWSLQLQEVGAGAQSFSPRPINISRRPVAITVAQQAAKPFTVNGTAYHLPDTLHKYAVLRITDSDYVQHHRVPYQIVEAANPQNVVGTVYEPGASSYAELRQGQKDTLQAAFETYFNQHYANNAAARIAFVRNQQGLVLGSAVERIAVPHSGSFFLYTQGGNLYRATFTSGIRVATEQLAVGGNITEVEVTPDGVYCVYKKNTESGIFCFDIANGFNMGKIYAEAQGVLANARECPNHIFKRSGEWCMAAYVPGRDEIEVFTIPDGRHVETYPASFGVESDANLFITSEGYAVYCYSENSAPYYHELWRQPIHSNGEGETISSGSLVEYSWQVSAERGTEYRYCIFKGSYIIPCESDGKICSEEVGWPGLLEPRITTVSDEWYIDIDENYRDHGCLQKCHPCLDSPGRYGYVYRVDLEKKVWEGFGGFRVLDVFPDGNSAILSKTIDGAKQVYRLDGSATYPEGITTLKINPVAPSDVVFLMGNNIYAQSGNQRPRLLIANKTASNICFLGDGLSFFYVEKNSGHVYRTFASEEAAIAATADLYREYRWQEFLARELGTKLYSNSIVLNPATPQRWALRDADGCLSAPFDVAVTAPKNPSIHVGNINAIAKTATLTYYGEGGASYFYGTQQLLKSGDAITISNLHYGENVVQLYDSDYNLSTRLVVTLPGKGVTTVSAVAQTSPVSNGTITIGTEGMSGSRTYTVTKVDAPFTVRSKVSTATSCTLEGLAAGSYRVSVTQSGETFGKEAYYEVGSRIFGFAGVSATHSASLNSHTGAASVTLQNYTSNTRCYLNGVAYSLANGVLTASNLPAGKYAIRAENSGYSIYDTVVIAKPEFWGTLQIRHSPDKVRINTANIFGNKLFEEYEFRIKKSDGRLLCRGRNIDTAIANANSYLFEAYCAQNKDSVVICTIARANPMQYAVSIVQPLCPYDSATVSITPQAGAYSSTAGSMELSYDGGFTYGKQRLLRLPPSPMGKSNVSVMLRDSKSEKHGTVDVTYAAEQRLDTFFVTPEEVFAQPRYNHISRYGMANGKIWLEHLQGGSGSYRYRLNNGAWHSGSDTIFDLPPAQYAVYLQDSKNLCQIVQLDSVMLKQDSVPSLFPGRISALHDSVKIGEPIHLQSMASAYNNEFLVAYRWEYRLDSAWLPIEGATGATYESTYTPSSDMTIWYRRVALSNGEEVASNEVGVTYTAVPAPCVASFTNQTVTTSITIVGCENISVQQVSVNAVLTIKATGIITIKDGITFGNGGRLILDTQGSGRVIIDDKYDLSLGDFEIK